MYQKLIFEILLLSPLGELCSATFSMILTDCSMYITICLPIRVESCQRLTPHVFMSKSCRYAPSQSIQEYVVIMKYCTRTWRTRHHVGFVDHTSGWKRTHEYQMIQIILFKDIDMKRFLCMVMRPQWRLL